MNPQNKPEKKNYCPTSREDFNDHPDQWKNDVAYAVYCEGYNQCSDDREKWLQEFLKDFVSRKSLPSEDEIAELLFYVNNPNCDWNKTDKIFKDLYYREAKALTKRIGKEQPK